MASDVIGIGYEGLDAEALLSRLRLRDVRTVIDVRLNAISRKRGLSKSRLGEMLRSEGVRYEHLPSLGNARDNREGFADLDGPAGRDARMRYRVSLASPAAAAALRHIQERAEEGVVALLCFEQDDHFCHREIILRALEGHRLLSA